MGRKKNTPKRSEATGNFSSEYLGLYGATVGEFVAPTTAAATTTARQNNSGQDRVRDTSTAAIESSQKLSPCNTNTNDDVDVDIDIGNEGGARREAKSNKKNKAVVFAEGFIAATVETLPVQEIEIVTEDSIVIETIKGGNATQAVKVPTIRYNFCNPTSRQQEEEEEDSEEQELLLQSFSLNANTCRLELPLLSKNDASQKECSLDHPFPIHTAGGAIGLLQFCLKHSTTAAAANNLQHDVENIGLAVEHGLFRLTLTPSRHYTQVNLQQQQQHCEVRLVLTSRSFDICCPARLPVKSSKASKLYQAALCLQRALAELFPFQKEFFPLAAQSSQHHHPITAKGIYALVDNKNFRAHLTQKRTATNDGKLEIPGFVPTLRPYQEAAVHWMLERERGEVVTTANEWELAWLVVLPSTDPETQGRVVFLPEYTYELRNQKDAICIFFCPFTCWLAKTLDEARSMTLAKDQRTHSSNTTPSTTKSFRGGILAEQMGLGKTCEVLACILANPDPELHATVQDETSAKVVSSSSSFSSSLSSRNSSLTSLAVVGQDGEASNADMQIESDPVQFEETWVDCDEHELGACICGTLISIFPSSKADSVVICSTCREPMHWDCAAYQAERKQISHLSKGILFRKRFSDEVYVCKLCPDQFCPCCVSEKASKNTKDGLLSKTRSRATVIVTPPAILSQWEREIQRHTKTADGSHHLKVVKYPGVRNLLRDGRHNDDSFRLLHPRWLADTDIILMTFDALRHDLGHSDSNPFAAGTGRTSLRKRKRYRVVPSPLSSIFWWRVCLDEAQRIETPTAGSAQMALKLDTQLRWAVSGTPIGKGRLEDLFGLLLFLQVTPPFDQKAWFERCFSARASGYLGKRLQHLLGKAFWRSTKALDIVAEQMGVPPQVETTSILKFSSVEKHFYKRQLETTVEIATDITKLDLKRKNGGKGSFDILTRELHKLRAACCHPQVGCHGLAKKNRTGSSEGAKVLSMAEVLDRLIDDAKNQCEEALRVVLFHSNPMAAIARLKVAAKNDHQIEMVTEADVYLCSQSSKLYQDALDLADENAHPSLLTGHAMLSGSRGFRSSQKYFRNGKALLDWQIHREGQDTKNLRSPESRLAANFEFEGQPKKMCQIRLRPVSTLPADLASESSWKLRYPRDCVLQVSNSTLGGEFVDILSFALPDLRNRGSDADDWTIHGGFWIYRSKLWRLVIKSFHDKKEPNVAATSGEYVGIEVELFEPTVGSDSLQRLHTLHNAIISFRQLQSTMESTNATETSTDEVKLALAITPGQIEERVLAMEADAARIEQYHLEYAKTIRLESRRHLESLSTQRESIEQELFHLSKPHGARKPLGFWDVRWWDDALVAIRLNCSPVEQLVLCDKVSEAIGSCSGVSKAFPSFQDVRGLHIALKLRLEDTLSAFENGQEKECIQSVLAMSPNPSLAELLENQICGVCKADWGQRGPKCRHCVVGDKLKEIDTEKLKLERAILDAVLKFCKTTRSGTRNTSVLKNIAKVATKFFEVYDSSRKEVLAASRLWRIHLDLLNVIDELNSCKTSMRLLHEGEDLRGLTEEQKGSIIVPIDICLKFEEHKAKQAMALGRLRQHKDTLGYLKSQTATNDGSEDTCMICLSNFNSDRGVLACGHSFCLACIEKLKSRSGGSRMISCPLRCKTSRTKYDDILIASSKRRDDGSQSLRKVKGSWGTKVTAICSDLLAVSDLGEKSVVFSMWEDMLDIMEEALNANGVGFIRASSLSRIGEATKSFCSPDCFVLLLNVKNGAEGLNLIEATHVFMIEPLLNCGLDSQATARIHRIGQTRKTFLHRYLVENTIEIKVDKYRKQHQQEEQLEDAILDSRKCAIQAGGIDGGFSSKEELMDMLNLQSD